MPEVSVCTPGTTNLRVLEFSILVGETFELESGSRLEPEHIENLKFAVVGFFPIAVVQ